MYQVCAALLSCFVFDEKSDEDAGRLPEELKRPIEILKAKARRVATVQVCIMRVCVYSLVIGRVYVYSRSSAVVRILRGGANE